MAVALFGSSLSASSSLAWAFPKSPRKIYEYPSLFRMLGVCPGQFDGGRVATIGKIEPA